jgi:hypothetical protein
MRKVILVLLLAVVSMGAKAEWVNIYSDENFSVFADPSTISKNGNLVKMKSLYDFKAAQAIATSNPSQSETWQKEFDCQIKQYRPLHMALYTENMGKGTAIRISDEVGNWTPILTESLNEIEWKTACGKK